MVVSGLETVSLFPPGQTDSLMSVLSLEKDKLCRHYLHW